MAKTITRWSPDTCDCVLEYEWDTTTTEDERVHSFKNMVHKCNAHGGIVDHAETYTHVLQENQTKNRVINAVFSKVSRLKYTQTNENGDQTDTLHPSITYEWSFTGKNQQRQLQANLKGANLSQQERSDLASELKKLDKPVTLS